MDMVKVFSRARVACGAVRSDSAVLTIEGVKDAVVIPPFAEKFAGYKRGYNWRFDFAEEIGADGGKRTVVRCQLLFKTVSDLKQIISPYPCDVGRREDSCCEAIREAVGAAYLTGRENGVEVRECGSTTIIEEGIGGEVVRGFADDLAKINRVIVVMCRGDFGLRDA